MRGRSAASVILDHCRQGLGDLATVSVDCLPWASATFEGVRCRIVFTTDDADPRAFLRDLPEADIAIGGGFVADIDVVSCSPHPDGWTVALEALVIDLTDA